MKVLRVIIGGTVMRVAINSKNFFHFIRKIIKSRVGLFYFKPRFHRKIAYVVLTLSILTFFYCSQEDSEILSPQTQSNDQVFVGMPLGLARIIELSNNTQELTDETAYAKYLESIQYVGTVCSGPAKGLIKNSSQNVYSYVLADSIIEIITALSNLQVNTCLRMYNSYEEYLAFTLVCDPEDIFTSDTIYLSLYSNSASIDYEHPKYSFVEISDTTLWVNDFYADYYGGMTKPTDLVVPQFGGSDGQLELGYVCTLNEYGAIQAYYEHIGYVFKSEFVGKSMLTMLAPEWIMQLANYYHVDPSQIIHEISSYVGEQDWSSFFNKYLSVIEFAGQKLVLIYNLYGTWARICEQMTAIMEAPGIWSTCTRIDRDFISLWCSNTLDFPYGDDYQDQLIQICKSWQDNCTTINNGILLTNALALNLNNQSIACAGCALNTSGLNKISMDGNTASAEDWDGDLIPNITDNCACVENADQQDLFDEFGYGEPDGKGDACQDFDGDGVINAFDNCPREFNPDQADEDEDGIGDICESLVVGFDLDDCFNDSDGDGIVDCIDLCPDHPSDQDDIDHDGVGDECDNCNDYWNPDQNFNPCDSLVEPEINPDCSQEEIDQEMEIWNDFVDCLGTASNNYSRPEPISSDVQGNPYLDEPRVCIQSRIAQLGNDVLCSWWSYNPALQLEGNHPIPIWGAYDFTCSDFEQIDLNDYNIQIQNILTCCKSQSYLPDIDNQISITRDILGCIPNPIPEFNCVHLKFSFQRMRDVYEASLNSLLERKAITEAKIGATCN